MPLTLGGQDLSEDIEEIRRHFRNETGKLTNWIYHRRIDEYFHKKEEKKSGPSTK